MNPVRTDRPYKSFIIFIVRITTYKSFITFIVRITNKSDNKIKKNLCVTCYGI